MRKKEKKKNKFGRERKKERKGHERTAFKACLNEKERKKKKKRKKRN